VKPVKNNNKENSASKKQPRRQNHRRAHTVGIPVNQGKSAFVLESEGLSVVPYFKKTPMPRDSPRLKWSMNQLTNQPTITRKENYANGRWNETPPKTVLPQPPSHWLTPRRESKPVAPLTSTLKSLQLSSFSSCSVDEDDDDISLVSGIDSVSSCDFPSRLCQDSVYDSGFSQILSEASLSELASFSIDSSHSVSECCEDRRSQVSSKHPPSVSDESESGVEVLQSDEGERLLARLLQQVEVSQATRKESFSTEEKSISSNIFKNDDGIDALGSILASLECETPSKIEESKGDILSNLFSNMKC